MTSEHELDDDQAIVELTADMPVMYLLTTRGGSRYLVEIDGTTKDDT